MKKTFIALAIVFAAGFFVSSFVKKADGAAKSPFQFNIQFRGAVPQDLPTNTSTPEELCSFAWSEFFSLNWNSTWYVTQSQRGMPAPGWNYANDPSPFPATPLVWETYAHRTELRPFNNPIKPFDTRPFYDFGTQPVPLPHTDTQVFHCLDENNEIGSCDLYAYANTYGKKYQVLYQAKCNRDEYDYIRTNYPTKDSLLAATTRTADNLQKYNRYYPGAPLLNCNLDYTERVVVLPCGATPKPGNTGTYDGAIEVKTAWRPITPNDDTTKFFRRKVLIFEKLNGVTVSLNKTYLLIALHIIHKTKNYPNFVFATFEHVDVQKSNMGYQLLDRKGNDSLGLMINYPRFHPIPAIADASTAEAHKLLKLQNPNSIWQYYRLTGVQGNPTNDTRSFSFFLANYVVESDQTLGDFHGSGIHTPHDGGNNIVYMGKKLSMGGCQGCHGVAQLQLGTDMSFLLDTVGKPVPGPDISIGGNKLQRYLQAFQNIKADRELRLNLKGKKKK